MYYEGEKCIKLEGDNIKKVRKILSFIPSNFGSVPLKFSNMNGICYASIQTLTPTISMCLSVIIQLQKIDNLTEDFYIKAPINNIFINNLLGGSFDTIFIYENKIEAIKKDKTIIEYSFMYLKDDDKIELPYTNTELYDSIIEKNPNVKGDNIIINIDDEDIKEVLDCWSIIRTSDKDKSLIKVKTNENGIELSSKDTLENSFVCTIDYKDNDKSVSINNIFDKMLIEVFEKINKIKDDDTVSLLISSPIMIFTIVNDKDNFCITFGVPSKE